ncbi:MAG: PmbA protein [Actinomycetota bacterium]|nr:PmbA protein [Actinomycetota bacterium]
MSTDPGAIPGGAPVIDRDQARRAAEAALELPGADGVEVLLIGSSVGVTRFANSQIIQNTARDEVRAYVRVAVDHRVASAATNQLDPVQLKRAAASAMEAAKASLPDPAWPGLPDPTEVGRPEPVLRWDQDTADASPARRAAAVDDILKAAGDAGAAGIYETGAHSYALLSSKGVDCYDAFTRCVTTALLDHGDSTGWGEGSSHRAASVDHVAAATRAREKALRGKAPAPGEPGTYEVILEPSAVATLLDYLSYMGFGAKQVLEGESFLSAHTGEQVAAPTVTIADDVFDELSVGIGFDFEGVPKKRVAVIDHGRATGPVTDRKTAAKLGAPVTGHYSGSGEVGPYATNVVLDPGDRSREELIGAVDEGILVTRFHYVNVLDRPSTLLTGMTRDGTFRISKGEIVGGLQNFRFAQNVVEALASAVGVGSDRVAFAPEYGSFGSTVASSLHLGAFHFASRTSH